MADFDKFQDKYIEDAGEIVVQLEEEILNFEKNPKDVATIQEIFRLMHTLKGSAGMFGFNKIASLTHLVETIFDKIRNGEAVVSHEIIENTFRAVDITKLLLINKENISDSKTNELNELHFNLSKLANIETNDVFVGTYPPADNYTNQESIFYILFYPLKDIFTRGIKPLSIFEEMLGMGKIDVTIHTEEIPKLGNYNRKDCYIFWEIFIITPNSIDDVKDIFLFFLEEEYKICEIKNYNLQNNESFLAIFNSLKERKYALADKENELLNLQNVVAITESQVVEEKNSIEKFAEIQTEQKTETTEKAANKLTDMQISTIKVSSEKLDELINLVSELVTVNSQLELISSSIEHIKLQKAVQVVSKLSKRFRNNALDLRLVPINILMIKFQRLVRDLSLKLNKDIEFITEGLDTELDKTIITKLESPLMHILRNSLDHGIEMPQVRTQKGKPTKGIIRFIAFYSGANVFIQVQDDGAGIDPDKILAKAIDRGHTTLNAKLSKKEIYDFIFLPGFSTAQSLTEVSGRGVGMDVVRQKISELRGEIEIDSELGLGTSVTLKLPLTLSIIDTMLVKVAHWSFLIPLSSIELCKNIEQNTQSHNSSNIEFNGELIPVIHLRKEFSITEAYIRKEKFVIIKQIDKKYAIVVDEVIGEHQAVFKPLGFMHKKQEYLAGASILGDGSLALILDTNKLIRHKKIDA